MELTHASQLLVKLVPGCTSQLRTVKSLRYVIVIGSSSYTDLGDGSFNGLTSGVNQFNYAVLSKKKVTFSCFNLTLGTR